MPLTHPFRPLLSSRLKSCALAWTERCHCLDEPHLLNVACTPYRDMPSPLRDVGGPGERRSFYCGLASTVRLGLGEIHARHNDHHCPPKKSTLVCFRGGVRPYHSRDAARGWSFLGLFLVRSPRIPMSARLMFHIPPGLPLDGADHSTGSATHLSAAPCRLASTTGEAGPICPRPQAQLARQSIEFRGCGTHGRRMR